MLYERKVAQEVCDVDIHNCNGQIDRMATAYIGYTIRTMVFEGKPWIAIPPLVNVSATLRP